MNNDPVIEATKNWVEHVVIGLNLCPFAKRELKQDRIRFTHSETTSTKTLLETLETELAHLTAHPTVETTLLIHSKALLDFYDYNDFLYDAQALLIDLDLEGIYQIASFHPDYQFAGSTPKAVENYTNRSPYPMLHILREESLATVIDNYPDTDQIPERNMALMDEMGLSTVKALLKRCYTLRE